MKKLEDYKGQKIAVNCTTPEQSEAFCKLMHDNGLTWILGDSYLKENRWNNYKEKTCYDFNRGAFGDIDFFKYEGYTIIRSTDFLEDEFIYGQEYEFSNDNKKWYEHMFLCKTPNNRFVAWSNEYEVVLSWSYARKINTERTEAITTIKELVSKFSINQNEVF